LQAAFATIHPELEDASRILGATRLQSLRQITAPLLRTGGDRNVVLYFHRRDARAFRSDRFVYIADQGAQCADLRSQRKRRSCRDFGAGYRDADHHFAVVLAVNQIPVFGANAGTRLRNG